MIRDIAALRDVDLDSANVIAFIRAISDRRDLFAHGIWAKAPDGGWRVILMRGNHPKDSDVPHRSRKINPEGVTVTADSLKRLVGQIEEVTEIFRTMRNQLRAQLKASAEIRQSQFGPVRRSRVPNLNKR